MNKITLSSILASCLFFMVATPVLGVSAPNFPPCSNPSGNLVVKYDDGIHGIVGDSNIHTGSDAVYTIDSNGLTQCFCDNNGNGIQTNWLKAGNLSSDEIKIYENQGWILVPTGAVWGLTDEPYLASNTNFSCPGGSTGSSSGGSNSNSSTNSDPGGVTAGISLSDPGETLANTGNLPIILSLFGGGLLLILLGVFLRKYSKN